MHHLSAGDCRRPPSGSRTATPAIDSTADRALARTALARTALARAALARTALARGAPARTALARGALAAALAVLAAGCSGGSAGQAAGTPPGAAATHATKAPPSGADPASPAATGRRPRAAPTLLPVPPVRPRLHQTMVRPRGHSRILHAELTDLWAAVVTGRPALGMPAFFPLSAYRQVKAIADPTADWHDRLVAGFRLDVRAAHALLGRRARHARLVRVIVPSAQASWINPGVCANGVGYWHVAGARVLYRMRGQLRSIGIASLISWRGRWYVVHFGAVLRSANVGVVDQPARGAGTPGPPGGC
jgi:hypothetical protein